VWTASSGSNQVGEPDSIGFGHQPEKRAVGVEAPGGPLRRDFQAGFPITEEQLVPWFAVGRLVGQFHCIRAVPLHVENFDGTVRADAVDLGTAGEVFEPRHALLPPP
jgi:hypothetical protein